jgi:hypothetical protein
LIEDRNENYDMWGFKDPRLSATYPIIQPYLTNPHVIFCGRSADETIRSVQRVFRKEAYTQRLGPLPNPWEFYGTILARCMEYLFSLQDPLMIVTFNRMMAEPKKVAKDVAKFVGVKCTDGALNFIDPGLRTIK